MKEEKEEEKMQEFVFQINADRKRTKAPAPEARLSELKEFGKKFGQMAETLKSCKDCEEWFCWSCDNESCAQNEKVPTCAGAKDIDEGKCFVSADLVPRCKDCDEYQCITCDNEPVPCDNET